MNVLFLTQGRTLKLFDDVARAIGRNEESFRAAFYVTDSANYRFHVAERPDFPGAAELLAEWELLEHAAQTTVDPVRLARYEQEFGDPVLWDMVVADRRLYLGKVAVREQDYAARFSHEELLAITQTLLEQLEALFDRLKPDMVVGFICVTAAEYAAHLIARARGIPFLDLRPTRLRNYFYAGEDVQEPSALLEALYQHYRVEGVPASIGSIADKIVSDVRAQHAMYEGVLPPPGKAESRTTDAASLKRDGLLSRVRRILAEERYYRSGPGRFDTHHQDRLSAHWFNRVRRPLRLRAMGRTLARHYVTADKLADMNYAFYPLHKEPEVTMLVYGRPFLNQIEVVRNLARSLPVGMKLLVKEHPGAIGYRAFGYYRKLLEIPNVVLASPTLTSREVLDHARLVTVIGGSIALEAAMIGRPVLVLGRVPFSFLPPSMLKAAGRPDDLAYEIRDLLRDFQPDEEAVRTYVSAVVASSVPIDFYSVLIGRSGVYRPDGQAAAQYDTQIESLARYLRECLAARSAGRAQLDAVAAVTR